MKCPPPSPIFETLFLQLLALIWGIVAMLVGGELEKAVLWEVVSMFYNHALLACPSWVTLMNKQPHSPVTQTKVTRAARPSCYDGLDPQILNQIKAFMTLVASCQASILSSDKRNRYISYSYTMHYIHDSRLTLHYLILAHFYYTNFKIIKLHLLIYLCTCVYVCTYAFLCLWYGPSVVVGGQFGE